MNRDPQIKMETAILANQKGFDWETGELPYMLEGEYAGRRGGSIDCKKSVPSCTQTTLQRWLREEHNIYVDTYHDLTVDGKNIQYYTSWGFLQQKDNNGNQNVNGWYDEYNDWKTYEEALEFGLQEALKLIKTDKPWKE
jgi:hypothetical protein